MFSFISGATITRDSHHVFVQFLEPLVDAKMPENMVTVPNGMSLNPLYADIDIP